MALKVKNALERELASNLHNDICVAQTGGTGLCRGPILVVQPDGVFTPGQESHVHTHRTFRRRQALVDILFVPGQKVRYPVCGIM